jgi:hypothetical protein
MRIHKKKDKNSKNINYHNEIEKSFHLAFLSLN